ncbi:MAG: hypothetical protein ACFFBP_05795 [Promethearchaeota archaeon]
MQENKINDLIYEYLNEVKRHLPWWIKNDNKELIKIIEQLESHIWEKAADLSEDRQPTIDTVRIAINHMGNPLSITQEYDQGKTPKIFISMELWPIYKIIMIVAIIAFIGYTILDIVMFVASFIINPVDITSGNLLDFLDEGKFYRISVFITTNLIFFIGIGALTIIFFWLSKRGYYPDSYLNYKKHLSQEKKKINLERKREEYIKKGMPISPKTGEALEPFVNRSRYIASAIIWLGIGAQIFFPIPSNFNLNIFKYQILFFLIFLTSSISWTIQFIIGNKHVVYHQIIIIIQLILSILLGISIVITILTTPDLMYLNIVAYIIFICLFFSPIYPFYRIKKLENYKIKKRGNKTD